MHTLLGPHLLQPWDKFTRDIHDALKKWQPPVCVVFMDNVFVDTLANRLKSPTRKSIKELMDPDPPGTALYDSLAAVKQHLAADKIEAHIKPFTGPELAATKLVGRIFIDDDVVEAHIAENPDLTAQFHHWLVTAAREHLATSALADRVNYWVIVNEILGDSQDRLRKLGQYEKTRMALAGTRYGCGLYAFANANPPLLGSPHGGPVLYDDKIDSSKGLTPARVAAALGRR